MNEYQLEENEGTCITEEKMRILAWSTFKNRNRRKKNAEIFSG